MKYVATFADGYVLTSRHVMNHYRYAFRVRAVRTEDNVEIEHHGFAFMPTVARRNMLAKASRYVHSFLYRDVWCEVVECEDEKHRPE